MSFKIGDAVWCLVDRSHPLMPSGGWIPAIIVAESPVQNAWLGRCWELDIDGCEWHSPESRLRPRDPPRDDLAIVSWNACLWRPERVVP